MRTSRLLTSILALTVAGNILIPTNALASTSSDLSEATNELQTLTQELETAESNVDNARQAVADNATKLQATQDKITSLKTRIEDSIVGTYKDGGTESSIINILCAGDISEFIKKLMDTTQVNEDLSANIAEQLSLSEQQQQQADELSRQADDAQAKLDELNSKKEELDTKAAELKKKSQEEQDSAKKESATTAISSASTASSSASTFTSNLSGDGWKSGVASAYGGSSDSGTGNTTANGSTVNDWSMGVAIPLAWRRRDLLGHQVEISYGGKSVIATINDLGGMGGGARSLDLQPGVFKALGASTCNAWGIRTVQYRIL